MYSLSARLNQLGYSMLIFMISFAALNHLQSRFGYQIHPMFGNEIKLKQVDVSFQVAQLETFQRDRMLNEDVLSFSFDMEADLRQLISWNTNLVFLALVVEYGDSQITVWDKRVKREDAQIHVQSLKKEYVEYFISDMTKKGLKERDLDIYLRWEVMSTIGLYYADQIHVGKYTVPKNYNTAGRKPYRPGPTGRQDNY